MSTTDQYVANEVIYRVLENGDANANLTFQTDMFDLTEVTDSINRVQQAFLLETGMIATRTTIAGVVGTGQYDTPVNSIRPRRVTWTGSDGQTATLPQVDTWELDNGADDWPSDTAKPIAWYENTLGQQKIGLAKTPNDVGTIGLLYIALATVVNGTGILMTVPDDWVPYIVWGALAELLSSDGPSYDPLRASYCKRRFSEGVELANLILGGY